MNDEIKVGYFLMASVLAITALAYTQSVKWAIAWFFIGYVLAFLNEIRKARDMGEI